MSTPPRHDPLTPSPLQNTSPTTNTLLVSPLSLSTLTRDCSPSYRNGTPSESRRSGSSSFPPLFRLYRHEKRVLLGRRLRSVFTRQSDRGRGESRSHRRWTSRHPPRPPVLLGSGIRLLDTRRPSSHTVITVRLCRRQYVTCVHPTSVDLGGPRKVSVLT